MTFSDDHLGFRDVVVAERSIALAAFATPIAAVLLAVELLLFEWKPRSFIPVAVAAIVASLVRNTWGWHAAFGGPHAEVAALSAAGAAARGRC